ncbi:MAG TPA: drug/metabolite exporter YedA [Rhodanobacteraceae bacterium]|nr:drug/metabolite exporter YedA [Rhodanobacteraceae bacterium]
MNDTTASLSEVHATHSRRWLIPLALATVYVVWGSTYLGIRFGLEGFPPFVLAALRFAAAGIAMYAWLRLRGAPAPTRLQWRNAAITGVLLLGFGNGLVCFAEQYVASGVAAVAIASEPLFVALVLCAYREWPRRVEVVGLIVGFIGVVLLNSGSDLRASPWAAIALLIATAAWAFGSIWSRRQDMPKGPMNVAAQMLCASVALVMMAILSGERWPAHVPMQSIAALAYLAIFGSIIAFSAYLFLLRAVRPALSASYAYVNPPVAVLIGALVAGEHVGTLELAGMVVILLGVALITLARALPLRQTR